MEANRKRTQVHMLPTDKTGNSCQPLSAYSKPVTRGGLISASGMEAKRLVELGSQAYHLYFTTDEEIKVGDWCLKPVYIEGVKVGYGILQADSSYFGGYGYDWEDHHKIIASTDPKLETSDEVFHNTYKQKLPQPSQAFIKAYCNQGGFDEVDVEYEVKGTIGKKLGDNALYHGLKVDPIHNTITTHRIVEKMYSRENLENLMMQSYIYGQSDKTDSFHKRESTIEKLIKENL